MCRIRIACDEDLLRLQEEWEVSMANIIFETTGKSQDETLKEFKERRVKQDKQIQNDRLFIFGFAGTFEGAERYIRNKAEEKFLLEWLRQDIAELIKVERAPVMHTKGAGYNLILESLDVLEPLESIKAPKQSQKYKYAKRVDTEELHCLEGSIRLMLRDAKKMNRNEVILLQFVYIAVYHIFTKDVKNKKEQLICNRIDTMFNKCKELTGYTSGTTSEPTWTFTSKHFIARTLVDPELIRELIKMGTDHKNSKLNTGLGVLIDAMASVVSAKDNKDEVYKYILNTVMKIIEVPENV